MSCWAPEREPPGPRVSPAEQVVVQSKGDEESTRVNQNPRPGKPFETSNHTENEERKPPYTAWTLAENMDVIGPNGAVILTLENKGVRVDVLSVSGQYAQIQCSGCQQPYQNHAGWVLLAYIACAWDMPSESALNAMTEMRQKWIKGQDLPAEFTHKRDLCMLVDVGFKEEDDKAVWSIEGGLIELKKEDETWKLVQAKPPTVKAKSTWRCDIQYPN